MRKSSSKARTQNLPVLALWLSEDFYVPRAAVDHLLAKMPNAAAEAVVLDAEAVAAPNGKADHFSWMQSPQRIALRIAQWTAAQQHQAAALP